MLFRSGSSPAGRRRPFLAGGCFAAVCALAYLPHVLAVGPKVLGYLPDYLREERYDQGGRFLLLSLTRLPSSYLPVLAAVVLLAAMALVWRADLPAHQAAPLLLGALLLVATPVQPWYAVSVAALGLLDRAWWWAVLVVVAWPYFVAVILDDPDAASLGRAGYALALAVVIAGVLARRLRNRSDPATGDPGPPSHEPATSDGPAVAGPGGQRPGTAASAQRPATRLLRLSGW